jgi:hypothetical protein
VPMKISGGATKRTSIPAATWLSILLALGISIVGADCSRLQPEGSKPEQSSVVKFDTEYQAVLLTNGQVFFGRLEGFGGAHPILREVYYIRTVPAPEGNTQTTNILVKRGQEWHSPDFMVLNASHILLVEPVAKTSKVAQLISEQKQK